MSAQGIVHKFIPGKKEAELVLGRGGPKFATLVVEAGNKMSARLPDGRKIPVESLRAEDLMPGVDAAQLRLAIKFAKSVMND